MPGGIERTPTDEFTGQPLSLLTKGLDFHRDGLDCMPEFHHQQHPGSVKKLGNDESGVILPAGDPLRIEGLAIRYSKGQIVPNWLHDHYHDLFYGPKIPENQDDRHISVLFGLAKVIPTQAIDVFEPGAWRKVTLNRQEHNFIRRTTFYEGAGRTEGLGNRRGRIGSYLARYALENFLPELIDEKVTSLNVEQFLHLDEQFSNPRELKWDEAEIELKKGQLTLKQLTRKQLSSVGESIVHRAISASVEPARPLYESAIRAGMVLGTKRDLGQLAIKFFGQGRFPEYSQILKDYIFTAQNVDSAREKHEQRVADKLAA